MAFHVTLRVGFGNWYMDVYLDIHPDHHYTGDGAARDNQGYFWIRGRVDDVVNVSKAETGSH